MRNFPTNGNGLSRSESPSLFKREWEPNVIKSPMEGGYEFRRRKFTRQPSRIIDTGYIGLSSEDYIALEQFFLYHQNDKEFYHFDYMSGEQMIVRFEEFKPDYSGYGKNMIWNLKIKIKEL